MIEKAIRIIRTRKEFWHYARFLIRKRIFPPWRAAVISLNQTGHPRPPPSSTGDIEWTYRQHRFRWIPLSLVEGKISEEIILDQMEVWIRKFEDKREGWDSYSISERLANWLYFLQRIRKKGRPLPPRIESHMREQATRLQDNLEYRGEATNNHLINNGRALYLTGHFLREDYLKSLGLEILKNELKRQFTSSGFLREGSSHYQLLVTRSYLEVLWYARQADAPLFERLADRVKDLLGAASFFLEMPEMPFIGDLSPDHPPQYFYGIGNVGNALFGTSLPARQEPGWHCLFHNGDSPSTVLSPTQESPTTTWKFSSYPDVGYFHLSGPNYQFLLYVNPEGYVGRSSHGHSDLGSFILYWQGRPLFVDRGRATFEDNDLGRYGRSARSHNSVAIDEMEPAIVQGLNGFVQLFDSGYYRRNPVVIADPNRSPPSIKVIIRGFERLNPPILWTRQFVFYPDYIEIEDQIHGKGRHKIESFFHFHPNVDSMQNETSEISIKIGEDTLLLQNQSPASSPWLSEKGCHCTEYGKSIAAVTAIHRQRAHLPITNHYFIGKKGSLPCAA